jgi:predicted acylesterase/phospholipase RssA
MSATRLVLSGGGPKGLAILGALHYLDEQKMLSNITEYWGTSIGSVISLFLLVGYTPFELFHHFLITRGLVNEIFNSSEVIENAAFCRIESFGEKIREFLIKKTQPNNDPTFLELTQQFNKKINIIGANATLMQGECFNVDNCPNMKVITAIEISCNLPFIFTKKEYNNQVYVDGGFINNYPIDLADNDKNIVLGICVFGDIKDAQIPIKGFKNQLQWFYRLIHLPMLELHRQRLKYLSDKCTNIELTINGISILEMSPSPNKKLKIFSSGYQQCRAFYKKKNLDSWNVEW